MSKELKCLKRIDKRNYLTEREHKEFLGVVEKALTEYEAIKNINPIEALECLKYIENKLHGLRVECERIKNHRCDDVFIQEHTFDTIKRALLKAQKEHKALEIIKEKYVNVDLLWCISSLEEYNSEIMFSYQIITEEEFNLLREILK